MRMRTWTTIITAAMEETLQTLVDRVKDIRLVLPEKRPKCWSDVLNERLRYHVYVGELLNFALVVLYPENNGGPATESIEIWKSLSYDASAGFNCPDSSPEDDEYDSIPVEPEIGQRSRSVDFDIGAGDEFHSNREENDRRFSDSNAVNIQSDIESDGRCLSFASVAVKDFGKAANAKTFSKTVEAIPCAGEKGLVLPMCVSIGDLPDVGGASDHRTTISVNISQPRGQDPRGKAGQDRVEMLLRCPLEEVISTEEKHHVMHNVCAEFPVLPPPHVNCQHFSVSGKHYLVTKVCNSYPEDLQMHNLQVFVNKNSNLDSAGATTVLASDAGDWSSFLAIDLLPSQRDQLPNSLHPQEEHTFVFQVTWDCSLPSDRPDKPVQFPLFLVIEWSTPSMVAEHSIQSHYHLPTVTMDFPAFIMLAQCQSPVPIGQSFTVTYTILNNLQDFLGITFIWMPDKESKGDKKRESRVDDRVVCQEPIRALGPSKKGSTTKVPITFQAIKVGVQELGKHMKLKLQYASNPLPSKATTTPPTPTPSATPPPHPATSLSSSVTAPPRPTTPPTPNPASSPSGPTEPPSIPPSEPEDNLDGPVPKGEGSSPPLQRKAFSLASNSPLLKKGVFTRQMSISTPSSQSIKKFLAGIRSHSFSGESSGDGNHDNQQDGEPRDCSSSSDPGTRSGRKEGEAELISDNSQVSVNRIAKHKCQVYVT